MGKWRCILAVLLTAAGVALLPSGCVAYKLDPAKNRDVEYTVTDKEDVPEEFLERIEEAKEEPFELSYADQGCLYAARGYGKQKTSGYSIEVTACYEAERAVYIETALLGPDKGEEITEAATYPYVVVKMEYIDKQVIFE